MTIANLFLAEPMLQDAVPRGARCNRKVGTLLAMLIGSVFASSVLHLVVHKPAINMASQYMQPIRAMQPMRAPMQLPKVWQSMQPVRVPQLTHQFLQSAKVWPFRQPTMSTHLVRQGYDEEGGGGQEETGVLMRWVGDRGFGFIKPETGGDDLFCHARSLVDGEESVQEGNKVTFIKEYNDRQGKYEAAEVRLAPGGEGDFRSEFGGGGGEATGEPGTGILMRYMSDRGFGFIQPEGGGDDLFVHVRNFVDGEGSVQEGNKVTYVTTYNDRKGTNEAAEVRVAPGGEGDFRSDVASGGEEKRPAPDGSGFYTKQEFVDFYGGETEWDAAPAAGQEATGVVMRWVGDRGFGFIKPESGGDDLFCHVRSLLDGEGSVAEGNKVTYTTQYNDRQGKFECSDVRLAPGGDGDFRAELMGPPPDQPAPAGGEGVLMRWMGDRGFGFINPIGGGDDLFCHVRSLVDGEGSVQEGNKVTYVPAWNDRKGNWEASEVKLAADGAGDFRAEVGGPPPDQPPMEAGTGILMRWMSDRGFGFIQPEGGGEDLFCHISSLPDGEGSVQEGNKVTYTPRWNNRQSKYEASEVRLAPGGEGDFREQFMAPPDDGQERRPAPDGSGSYTKDEFVSFYGGEDEWNAAAQAEPAEAAASPEEQV